MNLEKHKSFPSDVGQGEENNNQNFHLFSCTLKLLESQESLSSIPPRRICGMAFM
jgi:hypothetical protein